MRVVIHCLAWGGSESWVPVLYRSAAGAAWEPVGLALGAPYTTRRAAEARSDRGWPGVLVEYAHAGRLL